MAATMTTAEESAARERQRATLVAAHPSSEHEQVQKMVQKIEHFPWLSKAHHLSRFLTNSVRCLRTVATDPDHMALWIREVTNTAAVDTTQDFETWFEHMAVSGKGFRRADLVL